MVWACLAHQILDKHGEDLVFRRLKQKKKKRKKRRKKKRNRNNNCKGTQSESESFGFRCISPTTNPYENAQQLSQVSVDMWGEWVCGCLCVCGCVYMFAYVIKYLFAGVRYSYGISIGTNNLRKSSNFQWFICGLSCASCSLFLLYIPLLSQYFRLLALLICPLGVACPTAYIHSNWHTHTHTQIHQQVCSEIQFTFRLDYSFFLSIFLLPLSLSYCLLARSCLPVALVNKSRSVKRERRNGGRGLPPLGSTASCRKQFS